MAVYKEEKTNTWRVIYRYTDWNGARRQTQKRGFKTKREALAWERETGMFLRRGRLQCRAAFVARDRGDGTAFLDFVLKGVLTT